METIGILYYLTIAWSIVKVLGIITLFYFAIKLYFKLTYFLELKTRYLEQQMGIDRE